MILVEERASRLRGIRGREWGGEEEIAALAACLQMSTRVHDVSRRGEHTYRSATRSARMQRSVECVMHVHRTQPGDRTDKEHHPFAVRAHVFPSLLKALDRTNLFTTKTTTQ